jgi:hypothetical protein
VSESFVGLESVNLSMMGIKIKVSPTFIKNQVREKQKHSETTNQKSISTNGYSGFILSMRSCRKRYIDIKKKGIWHRIVKRAVRSPMCSSLKSLMKLIVFVFKIVCLNEKLSMENCRHKMSVNVLQLPEGSDFEALHCQPSRNFDRSTKLDLTTEPPLLW